MGDQSKGEGYKTLEIWLMRFVPLLIPQEATQWFTSDQVGARELGALEERRI